MKRHLVVSSVGDNSCHGMWLNEGKSFDLWLVYFGKREGSYSDEADRYWERAGSKWQNLHWLLQSESLAQYEYIFVPDDDLQLSGSVIDTMFEIMRKQDLSLAQPAFSWESQATWPLTFVRPWTTLRYTNFVENGAVAFSRRALDLCQGSFGHSLTGFGLDFVWQELLKPTAGKIAVIDSAICTHPPRASELDKLLPRSEHRNEGLKLLQGVAYEQPRELGFVLSTSGRDMMNSGRSAKQIRKQAEHLFSYSRRQILR